MSTPTAGRTGGPRGPRGSRGPRGPRIEPVDRPSPAATLHGVKLLVSGYLTISVLAVGVTALLRHHSSVTASVWTHAIIVAASAVLSLAVTFRAARGSRRAYLRLRIISVVLVVAIVVVIALPGSFPIWMKAEQGVCGLLLVAVVAIVNRPQVRASFRRR